jgi:glycosyltransferase involved in cell wall biosynthesis
MINQKISILYLRHTIGSGGGADAVIEGITGLLNKEMFNVSVAYLTKTGEDVSQFETCFADMGIDFFNFSASGTFNVKQFVNLYKLIKRNKVMVIHCNDPKSDVYGYLLKMLLPQLVLISTAHGWIRRRLRSALYEAVDMFLLKRFDAVLAVSESIMQTALTKGVKKVHLIHNGIDINKWHPRDHDEIAAGSKKSFAVGFIGRLSPEKRPLDFVRIAQEFLRHGGDVVFYVAGSGPEEGKMKEEVKRAGIEDKLHFLGQLDFNRLHELYQDLDVLLVPSYTEGLPINILEASSMRVPVVATNVGGVGEIIRHEHNGLLAEAGAVGQMAEHLLLLKTDRNFADNLGRNARHIVETEFSMLSLS